MTNLADALLAVDRALGDAVSAAMVTDEARALSDGEVLEALSVAARVRRHVDAIMAELIGHVDARADAAPHPERITTVHGCRSVKELVQRVTLFSGRTAGDFLRAGRGIIRTTAPMTGQILEADFPAMRSTAAAGAVGVDALVAVFAALESAGCDAAARWAADEELAASARGDGVDAIPSADELRLQASVWAMYLDPDGAEPRDVRALRKRGLTLGACNDGLVPIRGALLPEVAGQLQRIFDSILNPKNDRGSAGPRFSESRPDDPVDPIPPDERTRTQKQHDALASALTIAARSGELPTIGGAAPTLVVSVRSEDLSRGRGFAHVDGCEEPVSLAVARQVACTGAVQRVEVGENGRILALGIADRVFAAPQRKAITLRDGGCVIPGCHVPAAWCEIHHVREAARGGPTHTDNGVLLCWFHHRTIDAGVWKVRMNRGVPEVRGPTWWDPSARWHAVTKSPVALRDRRQRARSG